MERMTFENMGCWEIIGTNSEMCRDTCDSVDDGGCDNCQIYKAIKKLAAYENTGLSPEQIQEAVDLLSDNFYDADIPKEIKSWVERCTWHVRKCNDLHAELEKYRKLGTAEELEELVQTKKSMPSPFINDPFAIIWKAFINLYPDKEFIAFWEPMIRESEEGGPVYGLTDFREGELAAVFIDSNLEVNNSVEIFAHELAHVAVGVDHEHDDAWENAFEAIFQEYNRIGSTMFELPPEENTDANEQ